MAIIFFCIPVKIYGQENYAVQLEIMSNASALFQDNKVEEALQLLKTNQTKFDTDEITKFWYNWFNSLILYNSDRELEAKPFVEEAISFLDLNLEELSEVGTDLSNYLVVYFYATDIAFINGGKIESVIKGLERAKLVYEKAGATDDPYYNRIISGLADLQINIVALCEQALDKFMSGQYQDAIPLFLQIIEYNKANRPDEIVQLATWQKALGTAYLNVGDYNNAERYFLSSLDYLETKNLQKDPAYRSVLDALSVLYSHLQNYEKANILNGKAKTLYEEALDFGDDYVRCLNNSAQIQKSLGFNIVAKMQLDVALRQAESNLSNKGTLSETITIFEQFMEQPIDQIALDDNFYIQTRIIPYITLLSNAAVVYSDLGYFTEAARVARKAIKIAEEYGLDAALPYNNLGSIYFYKSLFPQSIKWYQKGYELSKTPYESDEIGFNVAFSMFLSKDSNAAKFSSEFSEKIKKNIRDQFAFMSGEERAVYWKHFENYLPLLNLIIYESGQSEFYGAIFDNILETKGLLLRSTNAIRDAIIKSGNDIDKKDYTRIIHLKQLLQSETNDSLKTAYRKEIEEIDKRLTRNINAYSEFAGSQNISWLDVKNSLAEQDIAIEFYNIPILWGLDSVQTIDGEPRYCAVTLRKGYEYPHIIPLVTENRLDSLDRDELYSSDVLYDMIWKPLEQELDGVQNIYFAADRSLHKIGIEYAPRSTGKSIGEEYNIYRLSSTRLLAEKRPERKTDKAVLYGGLTYDMKKDDLVAKSRTVKRSNSSVSRALLTDKQRFGVIELPGTLYEVEEIARNFPGEATVIKASEGTEESFKALAGTPVDILHLATHGFFWTDEEAQKHNDVSFLKKALDATNTSEDYALLRSGLIFSGANVSLKGDQLPDDVEDGVLTALELSNMNLGEVDMVVMSACESGLGETSGEGVFGLQRGFKLAGTNSLLMSLWKVNDEATSLLMTAFYRNLMSGQTKQQSLLNAQKALRDDGFEDPEYWAAFILLDALN